MAGAFYPPPPVFIGGAQPYAPRLGKAQSGPAPQPPPISGPMVAATFALLIGSWTPGPPPAQGSPRFVRPLAPVVSQPPPSSNAAFNAIRSMWEPPFTAAFLQGGNDIAPLVPAAVAPSQPPPYRSAVIALIADAWVDRTVTVITTTAIASVSANSPGPGVPNNAPYLTIRAAWDSYAFPVQLFGGLVAPLIPAQVAAQPVVNRIPYLVIRQAWEAAAILPQGGANVAPLLPAPPPVSQPQPASYAALYSLVRAWDPPVWWPLPKLAQLSQSGPAVIAGPPAPQSALLRLLLQAWDATVQPQQDIGFIYPAATISGPQPVSQASLRLLLQSWDVGIQPAQDVPFVYPASTVLSAPPPTNQALTRLLVGAWDLTTFIGQRQPVVTASGPVPQAPPVRSYATLNLTIASWPAQWWPAQHAPPFVQLPPLVPISLRRDEFTAGRDQIRYTVGRETVEFGVPREKVKFNPI